MAESLQPQEDSASATPCRSEPEPVLTVALASGQPVNNPGRENQRKIETSVPLPKSSVTNCLSCIVHHHSFCNFTFLSSF